MLSSGFRPQGEWLNELLKTDIYWANRRPIMTDPEKPAETETSTQELPPGVPEPPDLSKVRDLRRQMAKDRSGRRKNPSSNDRGRQARDIGTYTIIPMMMVAGPLVGYLMGKGLENLFGGRPWPSVAGMLFGLVAAFRQIFLLLARKGKTDQE
jgi:F0F1-type ATP synthase assembly protein I